MTVFNRNLYGYGHLWAEYMGITPWAFNQLSGPGDQAPLTTNGINVWVQPDWRDLALALTRALTKVSDNLRFYPRPVYLHAEIPLGRGRPFELQSLKLPYGYVQAIGRRAITALDSGAAVVYTDEDGDGVNDTGTVTINVVDPPSASEIQMFFTVADIALPSAVVADERYQIEPATVVVSGNTVTLTAHISYFVLPSLWRQPYIPPNYNAHNKNILITTDAANYVTTVDVYRVYPDATSAVTLRRRVRECTACGFTWENVTGLAEIEDSRLGLINVCEESCRCWRGGYSYLDVYYYAGYPIPNYSATSQADVFTGEPDPALTEAIVRLANCEQARVPNSFNNNISTRWDKDQEYQKIQGEPPIKTPFGSMNGQRAAWEIVAEYALGQGFSM